MAVRATAEKVIQLPEIQTGGVRVKLVGATRLVTHRFPEKAIKEMAAKQMKLPVQGGRNRDAKDPVADFVGGLYVVPGTTFRVIGKFDIGMLDAMDFGAVQTIAEPRLDPRTGEEYIEYTSAMVGESVNKVRAEGHFGFPAVGLKAALVRAATNVGMKMTETRSSIYIPAELLEIEGQPQMRVDMVRLATGVADVRFRPEFVDWSITTVIKYNASMITEAQVLNLLRSAGFGVGIGEWRPFGKSSSGTWGTFTLDPNVESLPTESYS